MDKNRKSKTRFRTLDLEDGAATHSGCRFRSDPTSFSDAQTSLPTSPHMPTATTHFQQSTSPLQQHLRTTTICEATVPHSSLLQGDASTTDALAFPANAFPGSTHLKEVGDATYCVPGYGMNHSSDGGLCLEVVLPNIAGLLNDGKSRMSYVESPRQLLGTTPCTTAELLQCLEFLNMANVAPISGILSTTARNPILPALIPDIPASLDTKPT